MAPLTLVSRQGEPRVDSRLLADRLQNKHKNVISLVERYGHKFEQFGKVAFQTEPLPSGQRVRFALLNENQSYFLLSLSRNTDHVVNLKADLVATFAQVRTGRLLRNATTFYGQRLEVEAWDERTKVEGSYGSRLLHGRRKAIQQINAARLQLENAMQSLLFIEGLPK